MWEKFSPTVVMNSTSTLSFRWSKFSYCQAENQSWTGCPELDIKTVMEPLVLQRYCHIIWRETWQYTILAESWDGQTLVFQPQNKEGFHSHQSHRYQQSWIPGIIESELAQEKVQVTKSFTDILFVSIPGAGRKQHWENLMLLVVHIRANLNICSNRPKGLLSR